jgi:hypothetical protein
MYSAAGITAAVLAVGTAVPAAAAQDQNDDDDPPEARAVVSGVGVKAHECHLTCCS